MHYLPELGEGDLRPPCSCCAFLPELGGEGTLGLHVVLVVVHFSACVSGEGDLGLHEVLVVVHFFFFCLNSVGERGP